MKWTRIAALIVPWSIPVCLQAQIGEITVDVPAQQSASAPAKDHSALWIRSGTRIYLMVTDGKGRRTGVDATTRKTLQDIPNSQCDADFIENQYTGDPISELNERLTVQPAAKGRYILRMTGIQDGPYDVSILALASGGSSLPSKDLEGLISEGQVKTFQLTFNPESGGPLSVAEDAAPGTAN